MSISSSEDTLSRDWEFCTSRVHGSRRDLYHDEGDRIVELGEGSDYFTFPEMLSIRGDETGRPGHLDLLSGLVKQKEIRGS
ncbi:hypothetical protein BGZ95_007108, partial [Linnemannia exigua]